MPKRLRTRRASETVLLDVGWRELLIALTIWDAPTCSAICALGTTTLDEKDVAA